MFLCFCHNNFRAEAEVPAEAWGAPLTDERKQLRLAAHSLKKERILGMMKLSEGGSWQVQAALAFHLHQAASLCCHLVDRHCMEPFLPQEQHPFSNEHALMTCTPGVTRFSALNQHPTPNPRESAQPENARQSLNNHT